MVYKYVNVNVHTHTCYIGIYTQWWDSLGQDIMAKFVVWTHLCLQVSVWQVII